MNQKKPPKQEKLTTRDLDRLMQSADTYKRQRGRLKQTRYNT